MRAVLSMESVKIEIEIPKTVLDYIDYNSKDNQNKLRKLIMYQLIKEDKISFGRAAEILGINKITLITNFDKLGIPYFDASIDEIMEDAENAGLFIEAK